MWYSTIGRSLWVGAIVIALGMLGANSARAAEQGTAAKPNIKVTQAVGVSAREGAAWRHKGDELRQAGRLKEALAAYRKAQALGAGDEALTMDIASLYREMGNDRGAYWEYRKNRDAKDLDIREGACYGMNDLKWARSKCLPDPYFADLDIAGGWQSKQNASYITAKGRVGIIQGETHPTTYYLFGRISGDNRSGRIEGFPVEYFENVAILGVGVTKLLVPEWGLKAVGEAGWARDLINLDRKRDRSDVRAGLEMWKQWNSDYNCASQTTHSNRFVMTAWGELMYYSRYDHATVLNVDLRPGIRFYETPRQALDAVGIFVVNFNSKTDKAFQYGEAGVGLVWTPDHQSDLTVTAKAVQTFDQDGMTGPNYVLEFDHYTYW